MRVNFFATMAALGFVNIVAAQNGYGEPGGPCGFKIAPCPEDQYCKPNDPYCTDTNNCAGTCTFKNAYPDCGGFRLDPSKCDSDSTCRDDIRLPDSCGMACDKPGICVPKDMPVCGGFAGFTCPDGLYCYDDPDDGCHPHKGGADCGGICL